MNKIKERLKEQLKENNITMYKLAKEIKVSSSVIKYWIDGRTTPSAEYIIKICDYFDITADYLLGRTDY